MKLVVVKMSPKHEPTQTTSRNAGRAEPVEIWKAQSFIEEHSGEELSLRKVAKAVSISANHWADARRLRIDGTQS
jgi:transcriptional regulator GlxA family with amidase domain